MSELHGRFVWYGLMTTDVAAAKAFYTKVVGWGAQDASTPALAYTVFTSEQTPVGGLMDLPEEARKMGATPRWMGYVDVSDVDATADRIKRLGGAVYVPATDSNIGRISVVADPQTTTFGLIKGLKPDTRGQNDLGKPGCVGWHELLAADWRKALGFYGEVFGWQKAGVDVDPVDTYQLFSAGEETIGGMTGKSPDAPSPLWVHYFNVGDIDAAVKRAVAAGGEVLHGPTAAPSGKWVVQCMDPQGALFALMGTRTPGPVGYFKRAETGEASSTRFGG